MGAIWAKEKLQIRMIVIYVRPEEGRSHSCSFLDLLGRNGSTGNGTKQGRLEALHSASPSARQREDFPNMETML